MRTAAARVPQVDLEEVLRRRPGLLVGYARVSSEGDRQSLDLQLDALEAAGVDRRHIFTDRKSGEARDRAGLAELLAFIQPGDTLLVWKIDRLSRKLAALVELVDLFREQGIAFRSLTEDVIDTTTPQGEFLYSIFGALAQFSNEQHRERVKAGLKSAAARGRKGGRPRALTEEQFQEAKRLLLAGGKTQGQVAALFKIKRSTFTNLLAKDARDNPPVVDQAPHAGPLFQGNENA